MEQHGVGHYRRVLISKPGNKKSGRMVKQSIQKSCAGQILLVVVNYAQNCHSLLQDATLVRGQAGSFGLLG